METNDEKNNSKFTYFDSLINSPYKIADNLNTFNDDDFEQWLKEDEESENKIIKTIIKLIEMENIKEDNLNIIQKKEMLNNIKLKFIQNEMNHIYIKFDILALKEKNDNNSLKNVVTMLLDEMIKFKDIKEYCKLHEDYINIYKELKINFIDKNKKNETNFYIDISIKLNIFNSLYNFRELFNTSNISHKNKNHYNQQPKSYYDLKRKIEEIHKNNDNSLISKISFEELFFSIKDINNRLELEEDLILYEKEKLTYIQELKNKLRKKTNFKKEDLYKILRDCKNEMTLFIYNGLLPNLKKEYKDLYIICKEKLNTLNVLPEVIPKMKDRYPFKLSKLGKVNDIIDNTINSRYNGYKTILHNEILTNRDNDFVEVIVSLIKLGANITLIDDEERTPFDYIYIKKNYNTFLKEMIYQNLNKTLKNWKKESSVGLRVFKAIIHYEWFVENKKENLNEYYNAIKKFVENNYRKRSKEDISNMLSLHIWHDENIQLKQDKENYFLRQIEEIEKQIESCYTYINGTSVQDNIFNDCVKRKNDLTEERNLIYNYLLESGYDEFKILKNEMESTLLIIMNNLYDDYVINLLINDIESILKEYPTQINMNIFNGRNIVEIAKTISNKNLNLLLTKYENKYGYNSIKNSHSSVSSQTSISNSSYSLSSVTDCDSSSLKSSNSLVQPIQFPSSSIKNSNSFPHNQL